MSEFSDMMRAIIDAQRAAMGLPPLPTNGQAREPETATEDSLDLTDARPVGPEVGSPLWTRLLLPTEGRCTECGHMTGDRDIENGDWCCDDCRYEIVRGQEEDHRLDSPTHNLANELNRQR